MRLFLLFLLSAITFGFDSLECRGSLSAGKYGTDQFLIHIKREPFEQFQLDARVRFRFKGKIYEENNYHAVLSKLVVDPKNPYLFEAVGTLYLGGQNMVEGKFHTEIQPTSDFRGPYFQVLGPNGLSAGLFIKHCKMDGVPHS